MDSRYPHALRGIGLMVLAVSVFGCLDAVAKYLAAYYPVPAIVWARYFVHLLVMVAVLGPGMRARLWRTVNLRLQVVRGIVLTAATLLFFNALGLGMPLAEAASISFLAPLFIAILAGPLLRERVRARTWLALAGGFAGALLIIRPGSALFTWIALLPVGTALMNALYQIFTRKLAGKDEVVTSLFYPALVGSIIVPLAFPAALTLPREPMHAAMFVAVGALGGLGHFLLIRAYSYAPATVIGPFVYAQLLSVMALGWLVFDQLPDLASIAGMLIIVGSGLLLLHAYRRPAPQRGP